MGSLTRLEYVGRCFPNDPGITRAVEAHAEQVRSGEWEPFAGTFRRETDGAVAFERSLLGAGVVLLRVEGRRISERTIP